MIFKQFEIYMWILMALRAIIRTQERKFEQFIIISDKNNYYKFSLNKQTLITIIKKMNIKYTNT